MKLPVGILAVLALLMVVQMAYYYLQLPDTVASHFDATGTPNGWMSKTAFVVIILAALPLSAAPTAGFALVLHHVQDAMNLPNKEYWLAPERRDNTLAFVGASMIWIESLIVALLLVINYFVCRLNIDGDNRLALPMIPTLVVFLGGLSVIITRMVLRFKGHQFNIQNTGT